MMKTLMLILLCCSLLIPAGSLAAAMESNTDRPGSDYNNYDLSSPDPALCQNDCLNDPKCKAWTYVRPNITGPKAHCWLKNAVPNPVPNPDCTSGIKSDTRPAETLTPKTQTGKGITLDLKNKLIYKPTRAQTIDALLTNPGMKSKVEEIARSSRMQVSALKTLHIPPHPATIMPSPPPNSPPLISQLNWGAGVKVSLFNTPAISALGANNQWGMWPVGSFWLKTDIYSDQAHNMLETDSIMVSKGDDIFLQMRVPVGSYPYTIAIHGLSETDAKFVVYPWTGQSAYTPIPLTRWDAIQGCVGLINISISSQNVFNYQTGGYGKKNANPAMDCGVVYLIIKPKKNEHFGGVTLTRLL
jgi:hypothetical protein